MRPLLLAVLTSLSLHAGEPFLVAHRGASVDAPENTLPAFKLAWEQGADAIEGDFHLTADGHIVAIHDADTKKVSLQKLTVATSTLAELQALDVGSWKAAQWAGTRIPTLAEVMATIPEDKQFFLEVKCGPEIVPTLLDQLNASSIAKERITVISFQEEVIREFKKQAPDRPASWLCNIKKKNGTVSPDMEIILTTLRQTKADAVSTSSWEGIDEAFMARLEEGGYPHHVWTVNDAPTARKFLALGTRTITTDRPGALRKELTRESP